MLPQLSRALTTALPGPGRVAMWAHSKRLVKAEHTDIKCTYTLIQKKVYVYFVFDHFILGQHNLFEGCDGIL